MKKLLLALVVLSILAIPAAVCPETGEYAPDDGGYSSEDGVTVDQAQHTIKVNECSWKCDGVQNCIEECVNK